MSDRDEFWREYRLISTMTAPFAAALRRVSRCEMSEFEAVYTSILEMGQKIEDAYDAIEKKYPQFIPWDEHDKARTALVDAVAGTKRICSRHIKSDAPA